MGWMLVKQKANQIGYADISDLNRDPMILWQHKFYPYISIFFGVVFPTLVAALWGDALVTASASANSNLDREVTSMPEQ